MVGPHPAELSLLLIRNTYAGTAVYFQTISAAENGVSTINLDGTDFAFESGLKKGSEETGAIWGVGQ